MPTRCVGNSGATASTTATAAAKATSGERLSPAATVSASTRRLKANEPEATPPAVGAASSAGRLLVGHHQQRQIDRPLRRTLGRPIVRRIERGMILHAGDSRLTHHSDGVDVHRGSPRVSRCSMCLRTASRQIMHLKAVLSAQSSKFFVERHVVRQTELLGDHGRGDAGLLLHLLQRHRAIDLVGRAFGMSLRLQLAWRRGVLALHRGENGDTPTPAIASTTRTMPQPYGVPIASRRRPLTVETIHRQCRNKWRTTKLERALRRSRNGTVPHSCRSIPQSVLKCPEPDGRTYRISDPVVARNRNAANATASTMKLTMVLFMSIVLRSDVLGRQWNYPPTSWHLSYLTHTPIVADRLRPVHDGVPIREVS